MYSLSPHNAYQKIFFTVSELKEETIQSFKHEVEEKESIPEKVSVINKEIESINKQIEKLEQEYISLEKKRNCLLNLTNEIIDESEELSSKDMYEARQLLRKHVCESKNCVQEISNLLNKKESELQNAIQVLKASFIQVNEH